MTPVEAASRFIIASPLNARLLVAISGGSDSTGLLLALRNAILSLNRKDISLFAATVDHALRSGSDAEAVHVGKLCQSLAIPHQIATWTHSKPRTGIPAAARLARYQLLSNIAADLSATCIVTGHTWNDQVETIAMRADRSAAGSLGLSGMAGAMLFNRKIWIVRPFLAVGRDDIRTFLQEGNIDWIEDPTNTNDAYERARVRKTLAISPKSEAYRDVTLDKRSEISEAVAQFLSRHTEVQDRSIAVVERSACKIDPVGIRALGVLVAIMGGKAHVPGRDATTKLEKALQSSATVTLTLSRSVLTFRRDKIYITREIRNLPDLVLDHGQTGLWDNRFCIRNEGVLPILVSRTVQTKSENRTAWDHIPKAIADRAEATQPHFSILLGAGDVELKHQGFTPHSEITVEPFFPLYDLFLPITDLPVANCVSKLFGRSAFPPFPVHYM